MDVVIVDDEPLARERLHRMVEQLPAYNVTGEAADGNDALALVRKSQPDVVLLDIHMPGADGLQMASELAELPVPPAVIFTTAHMEHALSAHNLSASAGYLLKPVSRDGLAEALARACRPSRAQMHGIEAARSDNEQRFVAGRTHEGRVRIPLGDVIYFRADQKYTAVCHMHGELLIEEPLNTLERRFSDAFLRVHRNALVARRHVRSLHSGEGGRMEVELRHCNQRLPVSRRRLAEVRHCLSNA